MLAFLLMLAFQEPATFRADVSLVHVDVEVRHQERLIEGLTRDDFRITDNGQPREVLHLGHQEEPLDLILLLDTSRSMGPVIERVAAAARDALAHLREGDRVAIMAFDSAPELIGDFTADFASIETLIREKVLTRSFRRSTHIQEAVDAAALHFLKHRVQGRRRAVLGVTDNLGMDFKKQALPDMWKADAVLSGVIVRSTGMAIQFGFMFPPGLFGLGGMQGIAEKTGGELIDSDDAGEGLRQMIQRLRLRYSVYYAMPEAKPGDRRKIKVQLAPETARKYKDAKVRARSGYRIPEN